MTSAKQVSEDVQGTMEALGDISETTNIINKTLSDISRTTASNAEAMRRRR